VRNINGSDIRDLWRQGVTAYMEESGLRGTFFSFSFFPFLFLIFTILEPAVYQLELEMDDYANNDPSSDNADVLTLELEQTDAGTLDILCSTIQAFAVNDHQFLFCHNTSNYYIIRELVNGVLSKFNSDEGLLDNYFDAASFFQIGEYSYFLLGSNLGKLDQVR
jgi:hypothetical protein